MVINTYVSCLISKANKHIIIHPVHLPLTLLHEDKRSRDFTHSPGKLSSHAVHMSNISVH